MGHTSPSLPIWHLSSPVVNTVRGPGYKPRNFRTYHVLSGEFHRMFCGHEMRGGKVNWVLHERCVCVYCRLPCSCISRETLLTDNRTIICFAWKHASSGSGWLLTGWPLNEYNRCNSNGGQRMVTAYPSKTYWDWELAEVCTPLRSNSTYAICRSFAENSNLRRNYGKSQSGVWLLILTRVYGLAHWTTFVPRCRLSIRAFFFRRRYT